VLFPIQGKQRFIGYHQISGGGSKTKAVAEREQEETKWTDFTNVYTPETETYVSNSVLIHPTSNSRFQSKSAAGIYSVLHTCTYVCVSVMRICIAVCMYVHSCEIAVKI